MIIAHISDTHIALPEPEGSNRLDNLRHAVAEINSLVPQPDLVIHSGDVAHGATLEEYRAALAILQQLTAPFFVIPGNRDRRGAMREIFADHLGSSAGGAFFQYALEQWPVRLIMLDTLDEMSRLGHLCNARMRHLASMLASAPDKKTAIFMHHPPFDVIEAPEPFQFDSRKTVQEFTDLVALHPQVQNIYCGHSHRTGSGTIAAIEASCVPAIAIDLRWGIFADNERPVFEVYSL